MSGAMELLLSSKSEILTWNCGICTDTTLNVVNKAANTHIFSCTKCKNSLSVDIVWLKHDYHKYPEDIFPEMLEEIDYSPIEENEWIDLLLSL